MLPRTLLAVAALCAFGGSAGAHPLPNFRYDREIDVRLTREFVEVRYVLSVSFWTIFTDPQKIFAPDEIERTQGKLTKVASIYCEKMAPRLAAGLDAQLGGTALAFKNTKLEVEPDRDHARFRYVFRAPWKPKTGAEVAFAFTERNFEGEVGAVRLVLQPDEKVLDVKEMVEPEDLRGKQPSEYKPGDEARARKASATLSAKALPEPPAPQPTPEPTVPVVEVKSDDSFWSGIVARGPKALFDTNLGTGALLLLAMMFGAFHAFAPGHGKSVAAAFLVGEQGTFRQAALLAASTTFAHTGSVILIALLFRMRYSDSVPNDAQHWLGLVGGLLVLFVGLWLFMRRLRGQVDHFHLMGGCSDMCGNHTERPNTPQCRVPLREAEPEVVALRLVPSEKRNPLSWFRVVLLGIGAGAIPCVDAVLLLIVAVSAGQLAFALPLLLAFSVGLSGVLMLIGMAVVWLHRAGRGVGGDKARFRLLPTASAVLLMAMGVWMARDAWKGFTAGVT
jgi:ABC-type nickel/cobalt efflux system permease component RcnA